MSAARAGADWPAIGAGVGVAAVAALAVLAVTFAVAQWRGKHSVIDTAWGAAFVVVAACVFGASDAYGDLGRRVLLLVMTALWGLRLAVHIGLRAWGAPEDPRYDELLARARGSRTLYALRMVYLTQGVVILFVSLPIVFGMYAPGGLNAWAVVGGVVWLAGLLFEAVGDRQLTTFKADPANRGRLIDTGLWRYTRHPNYFGDACVWWGIFLVAAGAWPGALTVLSPALMTFVLVKGTGKALTERRMAQRPGYAEYAARTSGFFPRPPHTPRRPVR